MKLKRFSSMIIDKSKKFMFSFITVSATKEYLKSTKRFHRYLHDFHILETINKNMLFISIRKIPKSRLEDMYPEATPMLNGRVLEFSLYNNQKCRYLFISNIKSIEEFIKELEFICQQLV